MRTAIICRRIKSPSPMLIYHLLTVVTVSYTRYFDVCPSRKISIGACLSGLCPLGAECINNYCCKEKIVATTIENEEIERYGKCRDGQDATGECALKLCPSGYICVDSLCCADNHTTTFKISTTTLTTPGSISIVSAKTFVHTILPLTSPSPSGSSASSESVDGAHVLEMTDEPNLVEWTPRIGNQGDKNGDTRGIETSTVNMTEIDSRHSKELKPNESKEIEITGFETESTRRTPVTTAKRTISAHETTVPAWEFTETSVDTTRLQEQLCPVGDSIGECISDQCPEGHTCFQNACCIITPQINCTDSLKGCLPHLCGKRGYTEFTTSKCAKTCARCHAYELASDLWFFMKGS
ncbi:unnamed protein product [Cylicocyclus nassatus]|uniref:ShKT domain-containing protein n=1 Tax=Cylicocyclus nassatus TaxID=53992 RepID=A0AA36HI63_CYLNA|nr:unnamed protein product [Cylicocyclus nassatus]